MIPHRRTVARGSASRRVLVMLAALATTTGAQSCLNYGIPTGVSCACPPGLVGSACEQTACGNPILAPATRPIFADALAGAAGADGCASQCSPGFTGPTCNTCTAATACSAAIAGGGGLVTSTSTSTSTNALQTGLTAGTAGGTDTAAVTCSTGAWAWAASFSTCSVVNPTLQSVFPGKTTLTFSKSIYPTVGLSSPWGRNGSMTAEVWYAPSSGNASLAEQFFCKADTCVQSNSTKKTVDWNCENLACTCIAGAFMCGGGGALDLTQAVNGLTSQISISCDAAGGTCAFVQATLQTLFGKGGLSLSSCLSGECVRESTIATLSSTYAPSGGAGSSLNSGVIGGLAVLAAIVLALVALLAFGFWSQSKARRVLAYPLDEKNEAGVGLRWSDIGYTLPPRGRLAKKGAASDDGRVLLDGISGEVASGQLMAILGPTGAGKSTLVDLLAGRRKSGRSSGTVELVFPHVESDRKVKIGYVDQHDVLPGTSTVREALMFAASLKLPEGMTKAAKERRVFEVLSQLGLLDCADTRIGGTQRRGISGGERRRLSIGLELLAAPAILIADEPTSGLDSVSAKRVVTVLKALANSEGSRTTVITTIHQPNSQIFHLFDTVLALSNGGRQLYFGPAADVVSHFAAKGFVSPEGWNPADYLLELASEAPSDLIPPAPLRSISRPDVKKELSVSTIRNTPFVLPDGNSAEAQDNVQILPILHKFPPSGSGAQASRKPATVLLTQFQVLAGRQIKILSRDWSLVVMHNVVAILVGLFVGGLYYKVNSTIGGFQSRIGSLFFLGSLLAFASLSALSNFVKVRPLFLRERANGYYSPVAFFFSEVVFDIVPLRIAPTISAACIVYWMVGLSPTAAHFFKYLLVLVEFNVASTLFNLFLAAAIDESGVAILISAVLNLFQMAFAGFFVNLASIPPVLRWLQWVSPLKSTLEALAVNEVSSGLMIIDSLQGVKVQVSASLIMDVLFGFKPDAYDRDVLVLFAFIGGFALMLVATVIYRLKEMR